MSDTATQPTTADSLNAVLKSAPELGQSPGLAVGIATSGGDVQSKAQQVARTTNAIADSSAKANVQSSVGGDISSFLNSFGNSVAHYASDVVRPVEQGGKTALGDIGGVLNKPLSVAQHEWRYLHDVEARHGMLAGVMEGLGIAAGAGLGFLGGGVYGAELGGGVAAGLEGQVFYRDSWQRTSNGTMYTDPNTHAPVSFGRDIASLLGLRRGTLTFQIASGAIDGIADMNVGGNELLGLAGQARSVEGARGILGNYFPGISAATAEDFQNAYLRYGSVQNAMKDIAGKSAGEIMATPAYQSLNMIAPRSTTAAADVMSGNDFVKALGNAGTADDVAAVFRDMLRTHELVGMDSIPTLSFTRVPFQALREWAEGAQAEMGAEATHVQNLARKFIRLPSAADESGAISMKAFDPSSPTDNGAVGLYRMLMFTENRRTAASVVDNYINGNLQQRIRIYRNAVMDVLMHKAGVGPEDFNSADLRNIKEALDNFTGGGEPGAEGWMGINDRGENISYIGDTSDGNRQYAAAIHDNQTGKLRFVSLAAMNDAARTIGGYRSLFGRAASPVAHALIGDAATTDEYTTASDFLYNHVTQNLFKPLVLLTPSYALHIALAEVIPNALRLGVTNMVRAGVAINAAKLGLKTESEEEIKALTGLVWRITGLHRAETAARYVAEGGESRMAQRIQLAARYIESMGGDYVHPALSSGHNISSEVSKEVRSTNLIRTAVHDSPTNRGSEFGKFGNDSEHFMETWHDWLNQYIIPEEKSQIAAQRLASSLRAGRTLDQATGDAASAVSAWLHEQPQAYLDRYLRADPTSKSIVGDRPLGTDQLDDWAQNVVADLRGNTRGVNNGPVHLSLLDKIADGERITPEDLEAIPENERPGNVVGRKVVPQPPSSPIRNFANQGFQHVLNPIVNYLSRQPIAFAEFEKQYARLEPKIAAGLMDEDEAMTIAMSKTSQIVIRNVHNLTDRTQWTVALRNWAPFYFAQEQAYRRMGRLLAQNPAAFRRYMLMIANLHDVGNIFGGQNGQSYFVIPHTGWLTPSLVSGASHFFPITGSSPVGMGWNLTSASVVFPLSSGARPDLGPVAAIPIQAIADFFPEMLHAAGVSAPALQSDIVNAENFAVGQTANTALWEQFIPNTIALRLIQAAVADQGGAFLPNRSFNSTMMQTLAAMDYQGTLPKGAANETVAGLQAAADRARNQTRLMYFMKALVGALTPVSPEVQPSGANLRRAYDADVAAWDIATTPGAGSLASQGFSMNDLGFPKELNDDIAREGSLSKGIQEYIAKHPDATAQSVFLAKEGQAAVPFTVSQSGTPSGDYLVASTQAEQWINNHSALIAKYPNAAFYLMPQLTNTAYNATIYNEQLAQGYRVKLLPGSSQGATGQLPSFIQQLYIAAGNAQFFNTIYPAYLKSIQGLTSAQKYPIEQQFYNVTLPQFEAQNPIWGQYWVDGTSNAEGLSMKRQQEVTELQAMFANGDAPPGIMSDEIKSVLQVYDDYKQAITWGTQNNFAGEKQSDINANWEAYLQGVVYGTPTTPPHPELAAFINGVFKTIPKPTTGTNNAG